MTAPDPKRRTTARPQTVAGVTFHCYRIGMMRYAWISEDGRLEVQRRHSGAESFMALVDGTAVEGNSPGRAKRFRSETAAMLAAVFAMERAAR